MVMVLSAPMPDVRGEVLQGQSKQGYAHICMGGEDSDKFIIHSPLSIPNDDFQIHKKEKREGTSRVP